MLALWSRMPKEDRAPWSTKRQLGIVAAIIAALYAVGAVVAAVNGGGQAHEPAPTFASTEFSGSGVITTPRLDDVGCDFQGGQYGGLVPDASLSIDGWGSRHYNGVGEGKVQSVADTGSSCRFSFTVSDVSNGMESYNILAPDGLLIGSATSDELRSGFVELEV